MDVKLAAQRTTDAHVSALSLARDAELPKATAAHLRYMNSRIQDGTVTGEKAHRWLGWMQATVYLAGAATHDALQQINETS